MQLLEGWATGGEFFSHCFHFPRAQPKECSSLLDQSPLLGGGEKKGFPIRKVSDSDLTTNLGVVGRGY